MYTWNINWTSVTTSQNPFQYIFNHFHVCISPKDCRGGAALGAPKYPHGKKQFQITLLAQHYDGTMWRNIELCDVTNSVYPVTMTTTRHCSSKVGNVVTSSGSWMISGQVYLGHSQEDTANPSRAVCGSTFRVLQLSQLHVLSRSVTPWTLTKNPILPLVLVIIFFQWLPKLHEHG